MVALRRLGTPVYVGYRSLTASGAHAPVFINSIPKAGTHLLSSMIGRVPGLSFSGRVIVHDAYSAQPARSVGEVPAYEVGDLAKAIGAVRRGTYANSHLYFDETTSELLTGFGRRSVFVVRDPRDILVSQLDYIEAFPGHPLHRHLTLAYRTRADRLMALISGWPPGDGYRGLVNVADRLDRYLGWLSVLPTFRFEEFASAPSEQSLQDSLVRLSESLGLNVDSEAQRLRGGIGDRWSPTMSSGRSSRWLEEFNGDHLEMISSVAGDQIASLGYN